MAEERNAGRQPRAPCPRGERGGGARARFAQPGDEQPCAREFAQRPQRAVKSLGVGLHADGEPHHVLGCQTEIRPQGLAHAVAAVLRTAAGTRHGRRQQRQALRRRVPDPAILVALPVAQEQQPGPAARLEAGAFEREKGAVAREQEAERLPPHPRTNRRIGAVEHVEIRQLVEADAQVELLHGGGKPECRAELLLHEVIAASPDRQHRHREIIGKIAVVLEGGEDDDVMPAPAAVPRDLDAIALQAAARKQLHDSERDTHRIPRRPRKTPFVSRSGCEYKPAVTGARSRLAGLLSRGPWRDPTARVPARPSPRRASAGESGAARP